MTERLIDLGIDFARDLGPRYYILGPHSGEEFRDDVLIPAFRDNDKVTVALDSVDGFSPSFLEETFGGMVREFGLAATLRKLRVDAIENQGWVPMITAWMMEAEQDFRKGTKNKRTRPDGGSRK